MGEPIVLEDFKERVILVGVSEQDGDDAEDSLAELAELVKTAGGIGCRYADPETGADPSGNLCGNRKSSRDCRTFRAHGGNGNCL